MIKEKEYTNITDAVNDYIKSVKNNFKTNINIDTRIINSENDISVDYINLSQGIIYNRAKTLFNKINKKIIRNNKQDIYVTNSDIKESIAKTLKNSEQKVLLNENIAVFSKLDKIIEYGKKIANAPELKNRSKYSNWEYYATLVIIDGIKYIVEFDTVTDKSDNKRHFRLARIYNFNNEKNGYSDRFSN